MVNTRITSILASALQQIAFDLHMESYEMLFHTVHLCGSGGQSLAYSVKLPSGKYICIKVAKAGKSNIHLERESVFLQQLDSDRFPALILDAADDGYIVEEFIHGIECHQQPHSFWKTHLKLIVLELASILQELTTRPSIIIHRDIKPRNLKFMNGKIILLDFGSAEYEGSRKPADSSVFPKLGTGTHLYQPFEQLTSDSDQDRRVDVFAAASIVYTLIEGVTPYSNQQRGYKEAMEFYQRRENEISLYLKKYPHRLRTAFCDALRVLPENRSSDIWELAHAVESEL